MAPGATPAPYAPKRPSESRFLDIRGLRLHLRSWGPADAPVAVFLHGGLDASATFQFVVDELSRDRRILAPDWRGHGLSAWAPGGYWFQDYLADLDAILDALGLTDPVPLVGHSLGGNVACTYAGARPERVARLISLDGFGLPDRNPADAPAHLARWLDGLREGPRPPRPYSSLAEMAERLRAANPRLSADKALFMAEHLGRALPDGRYAWAHDPVHRLPFATLHRKAEWAASVSTIRAPTLWIGSGQPFPPGIANEPGGVDARVALIPGARYARIEGTGHNLHHEEPAAVARLIEDFLG
jgi:pimeloyl-ACP methyl ester carboxylesterase